MALQQSQQKASKPPEPIVEKPKPVKKAKPIAVKKIASIKPDTKVKKSKAQLIAEDKYYQALYQWELNREIRKKNQQIKQLEAERILGIQNMTLAEIISQARSDQARTMSEGDPPTPPTPGRRY